MQQLARLISVFLVIVLAWAIMPQPQAATAQSGIQSILYGQNKLGEIRSQGETVLYSFSVGEGTTVIEIWSLDTLTPKVELRDASRETVMVVNENEENLNRITLTYENIGDERYRAAGYVAVSGKFGRIGQYAVSLTLIPPPAEPEPVELPEGTQLNIGPSVAEGFDPDEVDPIIYTFSTTEENSVYVDVRSNTGAFSPTVTLLDGNGDEVISTSNLSLLGIRYLLKPLANTYFLIIERGDFDPSLPAEFVVMLENGPALGDDGTIGFLEPPLGGCYITTANPVNIRSGGSPDHDGIGIMGANKFLIVNGFNGTNDGWYSVVMPDGRSGWVASFVVTTGGSCDNLPRRTYSDPN